MTPSFQSLQKTRNGCSFRLYATDGKPPHVIHGAVLVDGSWLAFEWTADGFVNQDQTPHEFDLAGGLQVEKPRCEKCRGTGLIADNYCSCALGRDLERVEMRFGVEGLLN